MILGEETWVFMSAYEIGSEKKKEKTIIIINNNSNKNIKKK